MKRLLFIIAFSCQFFSQAQECETIDFLNEVKKIHKWQDSLLYTEGLQKSTIENMTLELTKDVIRMYKGLSDGSLRPIDSIIFTKEEKAFIRVQLQNQKGRIWDSHLFEKSLLVNLDSIRQSASEHRKIVRKGEREPVTDFLSGETLKVDPLTSVYSFSRPIFIRNYSICFFCYEVYDAHFDCCEYSQLSIYKWIDGMWRFVNWIFINESG
ncbi:MAG: hypothetical protein ACJ75B_00235 [Flavisolibacter sp.]